MKQELDKQLCEKYPKIFRDRYADMRVTAMCWGFEHGSGWYNIIDRLCSNIQGHIDYSRKERAHALRYNRVLKRALNGDVAALERYYMYPGNKKWTKWAEERAAEDLLKPVFRTVPEAVPQVVAEQVKEKFGELRFYYRGGDEYVDGLVSMASSMSAVTCEVCGNTGRQTGEGWIVTMCQPCLNSREERRQQELDEYNLKHKAEYEKTNQ
jgi:hypothetical protein